MVAPPAVVAGRSVLLKGWTAARRLMRCTPALVLEVVLLLRARRAPKWPRERPLLLPAGHPLLAVVPVLMVSPPLMLRRREEGWMLTPSRRLKVARVGRLRVDWPRPRPSPALGVPTSGISKVALLPLSLGPPRRRWSSLRQLVLLSQIPGGRSRSRQCPHVRPVARCASLSPPHKRTLTSQVPFRVLLAPPGWLWSRKVQPGWRR